MKVFVYPPIPILGRLRLNRYGEWAEKIQDDEFQRGISYVEFSDGTGVWVNDSDLSSEFCPIKYKEREAARNAHILTMRFKRKKFTGLTAELDEQCEKLWGKNFTKSWQIRKTLDAQDGTWYKTKWQ